MARAEPYKSMRWFFCLSSSAAAARARSRAKHRRVRERAPRPNEFDSPRPLRGLVLAPRSRARRPSRAPVAFGVSSRAHSSPFHLPSIPATARSRFIVSSRIARIYVYETFNHRTFDAPRGVASARGFGRPTHPTPPSPQRARQAPRIHRSNPSLSTDVALKCSTRQPR